jgi:hypothetical protein
MKNKPYPALLRPSNLSNEIKKRVPKSRETIPLKIRCAHARGFSSVAALLLYVVGPWEITKSSAAGSLVKRPQWKRT